MVLFAHHDGVPISLIDVLGSFKFNGLFLRWNTFIS